LDRANLLADPDGGVLISPSDSTLVNVDSGSTPRVVLERDPRLGQIISIAKTSKGIIGRGGSALVLVGANGPRYLPLGQIPQFHGLNGLMELPDGTAWGFGPAGILRFRTDELVAAFGSPSSSVPTKIYDYNDGLTAPGTSILPNTVAAGGDGRLWFATDSVVVMLDSKRLATNATLPGVQITALVADGTTTRDPSSATLPAGNRELQIKFSALSLSKPLKSQVRYRLEGFDKDWIDPALRREAFYTNLDPGDYRFRVIAANDDGVWNQEGATLPFTLPPTFLQSIWFKLLVGLAILLLVAFAYRLRLRQITARLQSRFDARIGERERIARELHDTLLQGFQGLMLRFQAAANRVPVPEVRASLDDALERADAVLIEGRARVRDLRSASERAEVGQRLLALAGTIVEGDAPRVELETEGAQRPLHPLVLEEALRIAEEAMRNTVRHAEAANLHLWISHRRSEFTLCIRDNGKGIPSHTLAAGSRSDHYGLVGMHERARQIGGELRIRSSEETGTEVVLVVPARAAYADQGRGLFGMLRRWFGGPTS
jgi:signal transduction histidine kinase